MKTTLVIPTYNNLDQLTNALISLVRNTDWSGRILVINNGDPGGYEYVQAAVPYEVDWYDAGKNLGWIGGINLGLSMVDTEYITMCNDDVLWPPANTRWWSNTLRWFDKVDVEGVGPTSNYVAGWQSAYCHIGHAVMTVPLLIGFCATYRTKTLRAIGGLDESLPGGDDLDLSIRIKDMGEKVWLIADRRNYLHHQGGATGQRIFPGEWDSLAHQADTYNALIRKHGLRRWYECVNGDSGDFPTFDTPQHDIRFTRRAMQSRDETIAGLFAAARTTPSELNEHLDILWRYASGCKVICEFGVDDGTTTAALLYARPKELHSYDINKRPELDRVARICAAEGQHWEFHHQSVLDVVIPECDLLYIDDLHTGDHVRKELALHASRVRKYIAWHDTEACALVGEGGTEGIWWPIAEFLKEHDEWRLAYNSELWSGFTVLERIR